MAETITAYPLSFPANWSRTPRDEIARSRFGTSTYNPPSTWKAVQFVLHELELLRASDIIISTNLKLRNDGLPAASQREPDDSGAAVYFQLNKKPRVLACDRWKFVGENLWAIGKHIEALRGQERWGVGTLDQAFTGYAQLPAETGLHWTGVLGLTLSATPAEVTAKYYRLVRERNLHPDSGGDGAEFHKVTKARDEALKELAGG